MNAILFYHQKRRDGGLRTGVELGGECAMEHFTQGSGEFDSALEWWVNIYWEAENLPQDPETAREWLSTNGSSIRSELTKLADELSAGIDLAWPFRKVMTPGPDGVSAEIVCSAVRLVTSQQIGEILRALARNWGTLVQSLLPLTAEVEH